jgi:hypothetical protein
MLLFRLIFVDPHYGPPGLFAPTAATARTTNSFALQAFGPEQVDHGQPRIGASLPLRLSKNATYQDMYSQDFRQVAKRSEAPSLDKFTCNIQ